ncbi:MAG: LuxR C-terminal-related transcriptional regulator, partial [Devosia sp.]
MGLLLEPVGEGVLADATAGILTLTLSEYRVLRSMLGGSSAEQTAAATGLTKLTVQFYIKSILKRCKCDRVTLAR